MLLVIVSFGDRVLKPTCTFKVIGTTENIDYIGYHLCLFVFLICTFCSDCNFSLCLSVHLSVRKHFNICFNMKKTVLVFSLNLIVEQYSHTHKSFQMSFFFFYLDLSYRSYYYTHLKACSFVCRHTR